MKRIILASVIMAATLTACEKDEAKKQEETTVLCPGNPRTAVAAELQGNWMYGNFSMTEYWSQKPGDYLGNALQMAFAFTFTADGTYTQYFTSQKTDFTGTTYQQSVTKGSVTINAASGKLVTHPCTSRYKRTRNGQTLEERDLTQSELSAATEYSYRTGTEPNGTKAIYFTLQGTSNPLTFLQKF